ncbi:serine O-acetyltransferase [Solimonas soli]|uniref:serine O-acetyltransferase n=1 Tax=Solimonas soli TaxID=413479 RepID=UPI00146F98C8|nr:serine O-acetyltransferase [Solimonas soli]
MNVFNLIAEDVKRNHGNIKLPLIVFYRLAHAASVHRKHFWVHSLWALPVLVIYRLLTEYWFGFELPAATTIGKGLIVDHAYAIVVNKNTVIGDYCRLRHCITIGCKLDQYGRQQKSPRIGNYVEIGANAAIIGDIEIGDHSVIGAGAVVIKDVPPYHMAVGNPARTIPLKLESCSPPCE